MARRIHTLVTAGPTREMIDQVRDWGNIFSGRTGLDLALAFLELGDVTLLTSNEQHAKDYDGFYGKAGMMGVETFRSHADLRALLAERMTGEARVDVVAMTAAVADYAPAGTFAVVSRTPGGDGSETWVVRNVDAPKVKSNHAEIAVLGRPTEKLIDLFRKVWGFNGTLIKFKLEVGLSDEELLAVAGASRVASGADLMVANTLAMARPAEGTGGAEGGAYLMENGGTRRVGRGALAREVVEWVSRRI